MLTSGDLGHGADPMITFVEEFLLQFFVCKGSKYKSMMGKSMHYYSFDGHILKSVNNMTIVARRINIV
jgi:hypothetical protein